MIDYRFNLDKGQRKDIGIAGSEKVVGSVNR